MKFYIRNFYTNTLQIRNTQLRLIRYVRKWNLKHPTQPISRHEIKEVGRIEFKRLNWFKRPIVWLLAFMGIESPYREVYEANNDPITSSKAYKDKLI